MQIVLLILIFLCLAWIAGVTTFFLLTLIRLASKNKIELPFMEERKQRLEEAKQQEIRDEEYDRILEKLSEQKKQESKVKSETKAMYEYNELDDLADIDRKESSPDELLELLEFGIPDEELNDVLNMIESSGEGALS